MVTSDSDRELAAAQKVCNSDNNRNVQYNMYYKKTVVVRFKGYTSTLAIWSTERKFF